MVATFFLSSGRCGTQWMAHSLRVSYKDRVISVHEPLGFRYQPRKLIGAVNPLQIKGGNEILNHIDKIEKHIQFMGNKPPRFYVETGWPCFAAMPYLSDRLKGQIQFVHMIRHPIYTAMSMLTHSYYNSENPGKIGELALLTPFDEGVNFPEFQNFWDNMSPFEKCLYFWAEIHYFILQHQRESNAPSVTIQFESLFSPNDECLRNLLSFLSLPVRKRILNMLPINKDRYRLKNYNEFQSEAIHKYPIILNVAKALGYTGMNIDDQVLTRKYNLAQNGIIEDKKVFTNDERQVILDKSPETRVTRLDDPCPCGSGKKYYSCHGMRGNAANAD